MSHEGKRKKKDREAFAKKNKIKNRWKSRNQEKEGVRRKEGWSLIKHDEGGCPSAKEGHGFPVNMWNY